eukprot:SAG11_NODE_108_length_16386_cov_20.828329_6_plen_85_part_00
MVIGPSVSLPAPLVGAGCFLRGIAVGAFGYRLTRIYLVLCRLDHSTGPNQYWKYWFSVLVRLKDTGDSEGAVRSYGRMLKIFED